MFFPRLRRQAKWMFVFLALVFGAGFVVFGVGSNLPSGLGDILQGTQSASTPSVGDARDRVREQPRNPQAYRALADALQQNQRPDEAVAPLEKYVQLRPRDESALRELAGLYSSRANRLNERVNVAGLAFQEASTGQLVQPKITSGLAQEGFFQGGAFETAVATETGQRYNELYAQLQKASTDAKRVYERIARLNPRDPQLQLLLASSAERAGDTQTAIAAYERFLKLAPEDSSAPTVRKAVNQLRRQAQSSGTQTTVTPLTGGG
jgi:tetratricopeptide (TPR) repeat protein